MTVQQVKQRFGIIGNSPLLNRGLEVAVQVAPTDISVLVTGESGTGKEIIPQVIHQLSARKHKEYIAVNCGAIPEGTIDSELFGHEKGSFTGASGSRQGYFEVANGGTIFLDEVAELPMQTQVRLLRVLETGEFIRVGSSKAIKTNVRVVAATNENMHQAISTGKFREDLYYRLNTVPIQLPSLRNRKEDIHLLFRKFAHDFADKYRMPAVKLTPEAVSVLEQYSWPGNIRQLKNVTEQICVLESENNPISGEILSYYLPRPVSNLPQLASSNEGQTQGFSERDIFYKFLIEMKKDVSELKRIVMGLIENNSNREEFIKKHQSEINHVLYNQEPDFDEVDQKQAIIIPSSTVIATNKESFIEVQPLDDHTLGSLTIADQELEMIKNALKRNKGKRNRAAKELGISERTLYRKIKQYNLRRLE
jgi:transcriptional regulator with PAS, ATPase and Fis domain